MPEHAPITLESLKPADQPLLIGLLEQYIRELSPLFGIQPDPDGRFRYPALSAYTSEMADSAGAGTHFAYLIRSAGQVTAFALATQGSPASAAPLVFDIAEFFVLPAFRQVGLGRQAAFALWNRHPGPWTVRVSEQNPSALRFWRGAIQAYTSGSFTTSRLQGKAHLFDVFHFKSPD